ncbi:hypothetical protein ACWGB8_31815 [Kitasatospora sp. NPDC054939]
MFLLFLALTAALAAAAYGLASAVTRTVAARSTLPRGAAAGAVTSVLSTGAAAWLAWPSYLSPVLVLAWALGSLAGTVGGQLRRTGRPGRHT